MKPVWSLPTLSLGSLVLKESKEIRRKAICYMQAHQDRTQYKTLRDVGYHIGSGVMDCGCKRVVKS